MKTLDLLSYVIFDLWWLLFAGLSLLLMPLAWARTCESSGGNSTAKAGSYKVSEGMGRSWMEGPRGWQGPAGAVWIGWKEWIGRWWRGAPDVIRVKSHLAMYHSPVRAASFCSASLCYTQTCQRASLSRPSSLTLQNDLAVSISGAWQLCVPSCFSFPFFSSNNPCETHTLWNDREGAQGVKKREVKDTEGERWEADASHTIQKYRQVFFLTKSFIILLFKT